MTRQAVVSYCERIAADPLLVQGAGGNVSWKDGDALWVKASGTWLADAGSKDIFVPVDLSHLNAAFDAADFAVTPRVLSDSALRPSIETLLHGLMPQRVVVHVHALQPLSYLVRRDAELAGRLANLDGWAVVPYRKPGAGLAQAVFEQLVIAPGLHTLLLENHGVVVAGNDVAEVSTRLNDLLTALPAHPDNYDELKPEAIVVDGTHEYQPHTDQQMHYLAQQFYPQLSSAWALYPDHVVFLGAAPTCYDSRGALEADVRSGSEPALFFLKNVGAYVSDAFTAVQQVQLRCYLDVVTRIPPGAELRSLSIPQVAELLDWDAEQYRQHLHK
jgi:rhamnose utilization protein RhaD (predicted bifunctional aldolase and dehydrogenase)